MSDEELRRRIQAVEDGPSFLAFVDALATDRAEAARLEAQNPAPPYGPDRGGWENVTIEGYLDAAARCAEAHARTDGWAVDDPWRWFARFLYGGKIYE